MLFRKSTPSIHPIAETADQALDTLSSTAHDLRQQVSPLFARAGEKANTLTRRRMDTVSDRTLQLRDQALRASDGTVSYIRDEPVKAVLIAAAAGAIAMALLGLMRKPV